MSKKSIWWSKDCVGGDELRLRKEFYGYSAGVGDNLSDGTTVGSYDNLKDTITTNGIYEDILSGSLQSPYSYFNEKTILSYDSYSKESLAYLESGLEAFDIDTDT